MKTFIPSLQCISRGPISQTVRLWVSSFSQVAVDAVRLFVCLAVQANVKCEIISSFSYCQCKQVKNLWLILFFLHESILISFSCKKTTLVLFKFAAWCIKNLANLRLHRGSVFSVGWRSLGLSCPLQQRDRATVSQNRHTVRRVYVWIIAFSVSSFKVLSKNKRSPGAVWFFFFTEQTDLPLMHQTVIGIKVGSSFLFSFRPIGATCK